MSSFYSDNYCQRHLERTWTSKFQSSSLSLSSFSYTAVLIVFRRQSFVVLKDKRKYPQLSQDGVWLLSHRSPAWTTFFFPIWASTYYNPGQNVLGHLTKLGTKTHFAKLTHILPLKKAWGCCYKGLFLLSPSPPSSVDCVELKLEYITSTLHRGGRGEGRCLNLTSYCVSVLRVLTRVVDLPSLTVLGPGRRASSRSTV